MKNYYIVKVITKAGYDDTYVDEYSGTIHTRRSEAMSELKMAKRILKDDPKVIDIRLDEIQDL